MLNVIMDFFQNEILGMKWLNRLIGNCLEAVGLDTNGRVGGSIQFFRYRQPIWSYEYAGIGCKRKSCFYGKDT